MQKKIRVEEITDGLVLARPLVGADGKVLLNSGVHLKSSMISRLQGWGYSAVYIETETDLPPKLPLDAQTQAGEDKSKLIEAIEKRFSKVQKNPLMRMVQDVTMAHLIKS
jgi:hypothetical protein